MELSFESTILDIPAIRRDFPILQRETDPGIKLVYLDNAATSQKPVQVIEAMDFYYREMNANIHRGIHCLAEEASVAYENARKKIASFIGAETWREVVFTRNTTESINLLARTWGKANLKAGDRVLLTEMEHHSNIVPWQMLASELELKLDFVTLTPEGRLDQESFTSLLEKSPKLVSFTQMSNMLGTINPVTQMAEQAHQAGAVVIVDAAQSVPHMHVDVQALGVDFLVFSAHKMMGPTGIGIMYGRKELLEEMPPFLGGGDMIRRVQLDGFTTNDLPYKFEAGTPAIAEAIGLGEAVDYLSNLGMDAVHQYEQALTAYGLERLQEVPGITVYGPDAEDKGGVLSFIYDGIHAHDVAHILDSFGIAVRAGHHCAQPAHQHFCIDATSRASFYAYNEKEEVDKLIEGLYKVKEIFG
jgi:cysteine desulfurase/selenocysteine lyase